MSGKPYKHVVLLGIWEFFHPGHRDLIRRASQVADKITITVYPKQPDMSKVTDILVDWTLADYIPPSTVAEKKIAISNFLSNEGIINYNVLGPITNPMTEDALVLDGTVDAGAFATERWGALAKEVMQKGNAIRAASGFKPFTVLIFPTIFDENGRRYASSTTPLPSYTHTYAMDLYFDGELFSVTHNNVTRQFTVEEMKILVNRLMTYYEEGNTELSEVLSYMPQNPQEFYEAPKIPDEYHIHEYWIHRWDLYQFIRENNLFQITVNTERFWSGFREDWSDTDQVGVVLFKP
jgi:hypothetical protein